MYHFVLIHPVWEEMQVDNKSDESTNKVKKRLPADHHIFACQYPFVTLALHQVRRIAGISLSRIADIALEFVF